MFVYSIKTSKKQILSMLVCVVMLIAILIVVIAWPGGESSAQTFSPVAAADDTERIGFLRELGYEVTPQSVEVREVLIPDEFRRGVYPVQRLTEDGGYGPGALSRQAGEMLDIHGAQLPRREWGAGPPVYI